MNEPLRVLIADDNDVLRMGLASLLSADERIDLVGEAVDGQEAVEMAAALCPNVVVLDVRMPRLDGVGAASRMPEGTRILMLTNSEEPRVIDAALASGAHGYLVYGAHAPTEIVDAVVSAGRGMSVLGPAASARLLRGGHAVAGATDDASDGAGAPARRDGSAWGLTEREVAVMEAVGRGLTNREVAAELFLAEKTVKNNINRIFAKLGVGSRAEAVSVWLSSS